MPEAAVHHADWIRPDGAAGVYIGDARVAADDLTPVILMIYRVAGRGEPIILDRPDPKYDTHIPTGFGTLTIDNRRVCLTTMCGRCEEDTHRYVAPDSARAIGSVLALLGDRAANDPDPSEVEDLAAFLDDAMDTAPEDLALALLRRFKVEERAA